MLLTSATGTSHLPVQLRIQLSYLLVCRIDNFQIDLESTK